MAHIISVGSYLAQKIGLEMLSGYSRISKFSLHNEVLTDRQSVVASVQPPPERSAVGVF